MKTVNELNEIKFGEKSNYVWGEAIAIHSIGEYSIVEYYPHEYVNSCSTGKINYSEKEYSCYIKGKSLSISADSLDSAIVHCIAYKYDGANSRAANYFMKMVSP